MQDFGKLIVTVVILGVIVGGIYLVAVTEERKAELDALQHVERLLEERGLPARLDETTQEEEVVR